MRDEMKTAGSSIADAIAATMRDVSDAFEASLTVPAGVGLGRRRTDSSSIEEIKALKARYFRCMDTKDWDGFANVFTGDASLDVSGEMRANAAGDGIVRGRNEIATFVRDAIDDVTTVHHGHMPEIEVISPTTASADVGDGGHAPLAGGRADPELCTATATTTRRTRNTATRG